MVWEDWFRNIMENESISIKDVTNIIVEYYNYFIEYKGKFIQTNCGNGYKVVSDNVVKFEGDFCYKSAKLDTPIYTDTKMIYCWQIQMTNEDYMSGLFESFGVVSN